MKRMQISQDIVPLGQFKVHASAMLRRLRESRRPMVITQSGKPAAVVLTPEEFDRLCEQQQFVASVRRGLADAKAGRVVSDAELERNLDAEFGPLT
jgi:prevent-host-death family protein